MMASSHAKPEDYRKPDDYRIYVKLAQYYMIQEYQIFKTIDLIIIRLHFKKLVNENNYNT